MDDNHFLVERTFFHENVIIVGLIRVKIEVV